MRFQIVDLLLAMTIAAVYAAGFTWLLRFDEQPMPPPSLVVLLVFIGCFLGPTLLSGWRSLNRLGDQRASWRAPTWWQPHLFLLIFFFTYLAIAAWRGEPPFGVISPAIIAVQHVIFLFNGWIALGENGVLLGLMFVSWEDCRLRLDDGEGQLVYSHGGQMWPPRFPLKNQKLRVPSDKFEAVRALLTEKKPEAVFTRREDEQNGL